MEQITQRTSQWEWWRHAIGRKLRLYLFAALIVPIGFTGVSLGVKLLGQVVTSSPNPFASFADVFPGQPGNVLEARGFFCPTTASLSIQRGYCTFDLGGGIVSQVDVSISEDVIYEISFRMHEDTLRLGDLMLLWGKPVVSEYRRSVYLYWRSPGVFALVTDYTGQFSLFLPVRRISIGDTAALLVLQ